MSLAEHLALVSVGIAPSDDQALRQDNGLGSVGGMQLAHDMPNVNLDGVFRKVEMMGNPFIGASLPQSGQDIHFTGRKGGIKAVELFLVCKIDMGDSLRKNWPCQYIGRKCYGILVSDLQYGMAQVKLAAERVRIVGAAGQH